MIAPSRSPAIHLIVCFKPPVPSHEKIVIMAESEAEEVVPSLGGYDEEFINAVEDDLQCTICHLPLKDPMLTKCGHRCCRKCLDEHFKR